MIRIKRAYDDPQPQDGKRYLVDRMWPRGIKKEDLDLEDWLKDAAPSNELRKWYHHDPDKWKEFKERYFGELDDSEQAWRPLLEAAREGTITLVYASKETEHNNAAALKKYLEDKM